MLPLQQAYEVKTSVLEYIKATFRFKEAEVHNAFYRFIEDKDNGMFKGPYLSLKTPFIRANEEELSTTGLKVLPDFPPFKHQLQAFRQLATRNGHQPLPTLLTTGTGSGKTECFLYPILDYCLRCKEEGKGKGIKVIIMYPMNALATDQAKRLAEAIYTDERLKGKITAGLFIGEGEDRKDYPSTMGAENVIEARDAIVDSVPDILLTNFKMLDYGLMQQKYMKLWEGNIDVAEPMLRFMVLDELHTYDGAQGTDVANLIRRLKLKLNLPQGWLCPVGTSATIGNGEDSKEKLCAYASDVFGETFSTEQVIEEHRVPIDEFMLEEDAEDSLPSDDLLSKCIFRKDDEPIGYLHRLVGIWFPRINNDPYEIGRALRKLGIVRDLLRICQRHIYTIDDIIQQLGRTNREFQKRKHKLVILENLLAMLSISKLEGTKLPLVYQQVQLWQRELSGVLRYVQQEPEFTWRGSIDKENRVALPMYFCRDCGASGWISCRMETDHKYCTDIRIINTAFMEKQRETCLLNVYANHHKPIEEYLTDSATQDEKYVHLNDLSDGQKDDDGVIRLNVCSKSFARDGGRPRFMRSCPECNADGLAIVGGRTSTLSSVALSQVLSSNFDIAEEKDRKILSFTNSVQDAAHQAGFYEARTFRFLFRQSMQRYMNSLGGKVINLHQLQEGFKAYWKEQLAGEQYYYRFFPSEFAAKYDLSKCWRVKDGFSEAFKKEFDIRVDWEICSEFGLTAQIGRTLEKTGASASYFKAEKLQEVYEEMKDWLTENKFECLVEHETEFCQLVNGVLHRMRIRGGVDHPYFDLYRKSKLKMNELNWRYVTNGYFLNKYFGGSSRFPKFVGTIYTREGGDMLDITMTRGKNYNWYFRYVIATYRKLEEFTIPTVEAVNDFYVELFETLNKVGLVNKKEAGAGNYAINPEALWIEAKVQHIKCDHCQSTLCVANSDQLSEGTPCLEYRCLGDYIQELDPEQNYYQAVYNRSFSPRIYSHEHTGLLERKKREWLENDFKKHPRHNSINALTATSTLEMGIDIGDLNVVGNSSIPPKPSNFLQRIGRAGRKKGAALVLNYAHSNGAHDMFYFAEPQAMMEGEVGTPGCFLEAKDILRRHFFAYCIDTWTSSGIMNVLPPRIDSLHLSDLLLTDDSFFINKICKFIHQHAKQLTENFRKQYPEKAWAAIDLLTDELAKEVFDRRILHEFELLMAQLDELRNTSENIKKELDKLQNNDPKRAQLFEERRGVIRQLKLLQSNTVVEFMTNAGLLPNYAFPETGVKLQATIYSHKAPHDEVSNIGEPEALELVRPASTGIRELAPDNAFYTQKCKLTVSGINTFDWNEQLGVKRYCSNCDAIADEGTPEFMMSVCPKCGDASWGANTHKYLKFTTARSSVFREDAALDDRSEDRENERFYILKHFRFLQPAKVSYGLKNVGFGIEFCSDMLLTEANYGLQNPFQQHVQVNNNNQIPESGFIVCKHCGKATSKNPGMLDAKDWHYPYCSHRDISYPPSAEHSDVFEHIYLYRQLKTEAIKILLPVQILDTQSTIQLFKAGIELGMRYFYQSSPDHIKIDVYEEYNRATQQKDNYLVMYDTIPGGTGYLSKLYSTEKFSELIQIAYDKISSCNCQHEGKDGCYHCILSYSNQYMRDSLSRERAEELFGKLVAELSHWETIEGSVGTLTQSGVIEDSELELKFVKALQTLAFNHGWTFKKQLDVDTYYYELGIRKDDDNELKYIIHPQYKLGSAHGIAHYTIVDFQCICTYAKMNGQQVESTSIPQWAIYLDGYAYHAKGSNMRFYGDLIKRNDIREATAVKMYSWTLTWNDLEKFEAVEGQNSDELFIPSLNENYKEAFDNDFYHLRNSMERFAYMLQHPCLLHVKENLFYYVCCSTSIGADTRELGEEIFAKTKFIPVKSQLMSGEIWVNADPLIEDDATDAEVERVYTHGVLNEMKVAQGLQELDEADWNAFWRRYNLLQFFENPIVESTDADTEEVDLDEILEYFPEELHGVVQQLIEEHIDFNHDGGFWICDEDGETMAEADLGLENAKLVFNPFTEEDSAVFETHGYRIVTPETFDINELKLK